MIAMRSQFSASCHVVGREEDGDLFLLAQLRDVLQMDTRHQLARVRRRRVVAVPVEVGAWTSAR
jgi:hypothetical protein